MGLFHGLSRLKDGLAKTRDSIILKVQKLAATKSAIDENLLSQLEEILIGGDVGIETTNVILDGLKMRIKEEKCDSASRLIALLKEEVAAILQTDSSKEEASNGFQVRSKPYVILVVGVNGVGKTTTIGKLAYGYHQAGHRVLIGAADTFRAAANEQLEIWANRAGVETIQHSHGADPAAVAFDTLNSGIARNVDVIIIDTAGRLHTKANLMEELKKYDEFWKNNCPGLPTKYSWCLMRRPDRMASNKPSILPRRSASPVS